MTPEAYRERLLEPLREARRPRDAAPAALPTSAWFQPRRPQAPVGLADLYDAGVRCGHGESKAHLESRIHAFDGELQAAIGKAYALDDALTTVKSELDHVRRLADRDQRELQSAVDAARARILELETSTAWRMTAPLRSTLHRVKRVRSGLGNLPRLARLLAPRLATARHIAREQGWTEVARRVALKAKPVARPALRRPRAGLEAAVGPLDVPSAAEPRVSVIIPTYGQDLHTFTCLRAVAVEALEVPLEVIVADDAAPEAAESAMPEVTGVRFERNAQNLGFLRNCNRAAGLARGEYLLFLNNDAIPAPGSLAALLDVFERFPDAGAAGAKLVYPDGRLQEAGAIVWRDGSAWNDGRGQDPDRPEFNYLREADYCSAACLLVPARLFRELGGFDERYGPAYCEDTDLCFQVRAAGKRVYYQPAAEAVHFEGVSHGTDTGTGTKRYQVENQARFRERWRATLAAHRPNGVAPGLERDRGARHRVLFIEACMLTPDQDSGSLRTSRLLRILRSLGCKVTFVAANLERRQPYVHEMQQEGVEVLFAPYVRSIDELLRERGAEFDVVVMARYYVAARYIDAVRRHAPRALVVFDTLDLHFLRNRRLARLEADANLAQSAESIYHQEVDCFTRCDVTWVVSEVERDIVLHEAPGAAVTVVSNIHEPIERPAPFAEREGLLFVGGFRHPPNVDAAIWFAREVMPIVRELLPGVPAYVIGSNMPRAVAELEGVEAIGFVDDLEPWLQRCRLSVSPLRYGAGVKGKVNQAMSRGLPVVATRVSIEGMHLVEGEEVRVADEPRAFAQAVAALYRDEDAWNRLSRAGLANVERHFSPRVARRAIEALLDEVERRATRNTRPA
ncbi:MAG TPA: glycosyltransferase [Usitatibacter sp.]|jgi:GT2 family glycosyltransferase|nr:glycosyltransferase [Usitatibacter sp.]